MAEFKEISPNATHVAKLNNWFENRFPFAYTMYRDHMSDYYAPKNFNFWYFFGSLAMLVLVIQIVSGIFLTMNYKPDASQAFQSVEYIMRDVEGGWLIRYIHSTGAFRSRPPGRSTSPNTTHRRTSTSGTSSARSRCSCW